MKSKAEYVMEHQENPGGGHHCHWPGCNRAVPPSMWGCKLHWFKLPASLRARIWQTFRPGQEITKDPSRAYIEAAIEVRAWIKQHEGI